MSPDTRPEKAIEDHLKRLLFDNLGRPIYNFSTEISGEAKSRVKSFPFSVSTAATFMPFENFEGWNNHDSSIRHASERIFSQCRSVKGNRIIDFEIVPVRNYFTILGESYYPQYSGSGYLIFAYVAK